MLHGSLFSHSLNTKVKARVLHVLTLTSVTALRVAIWTLAGEGEVFGKEVVSRSRKILPKFAIPSVEYVS